MFMRKRYFLIIALIVVIAIVGYFLLTSTTSTPFSNPNEPENQENGTSGFKLPFRLPWETTTQTNQTPKNKSSGGGGGGGDAGGGGGGSAGESPAGNTPTIKYNLSIVSDYTELNFLVVYYSDGVLKNYTTNPPISVGIDANTTTCVALVSDFTGTYWSLDGEPHAMSPCGEYINGCSIVMDNPHEVRLEQNS